MAQRPTDITYPEDEVNNAIFFLAQVRARLSSPAVYEEFLRLLRVFHAGTGPEPHDVRASAYALLRGHPDLIHGLGAFVPGVPAPGPACRGPAPTRPKRERRPTPAAPAVDGDALWFLDQVSRRRPEVYDSLLKLISDARHVKDLNQIYQRAQEIFGGSAHSYLLSEFVKYLPVPTELERASLLRRRVKKEPAPPEEHRAPAPNKRKPAAAAIAAYNPSAAKRPRADDPKPTTNRRAHSPAAVVDAAPKSAGVSEFREAWEFETTYSKLVATARRTKELLQQYEPTKDAPPSCGRHVFEELFPSRECQDVLREMYEYDGMFETIRDALEDGERTELALRTIKRRLGKLEQLAVKVAMERRDRDRVEGRMQKLAVDRVRVLKNNQAKQSAGT